MHIMFVSPEVWPFARVGGLAEVSHDLPLALGARGHTVDIVTIKTRLTPDLNEKLKLSDITLEVPVSWRNLPAEVYSLSLSEGVTAYLIGHDRLFDREGLYGNAFGDYEDNAERFIFFSRAALELALALGRKPDVIHANDWTTGLTPLYLKSLYQDQKLFDACGSLMSVHNLGNQGNFWHYDMPLTGLGWEYFTPETMEFYGKINFLKAGLVFADLISTVSPSYCKEILTPEMGFGLEGVLGSRAERLIPVINGVDYEVWNPKTDPHIAACYSADDLDPKTVCKDDLRRVFGLPIGENRPLLGYIGRLLDRRGMDIFAPALEQIMDMGLDVVLMGFGADHYHAYLEDLRRRRPGQMGLIIGYEMDLAHKITAGADMLLMPSRFEPCGLHQLHAMRYGTVPVVRATGGLDDTVQDHNEKQLGVGFKFKDYETSAMLSAVQRALRAYDDPIKWRAIMQRAMALNFSWERAALQYEEIYERARRLRLAQNGV